MDKFLTPQWPAATRVRSVSTTRSGGVSLSPYDSLNLGSHVDDDPDAVSRNRDILCSELSLPAVPAWMDQVHGVDVLYVDHNTTTVQTADAAWTDQPGCVLCVMTADCLPVLLASRSGLVVAVAHGGWRGLANGILQKTVDALPVEAGELVAWLGPAIGPSQFEVGSEVREAFVSRDPLFDDCFEPSPSGSEKFLADIFKLGEHSLHSAGVMQVFGSGICTYQDSRRFFSHRRDQGKTGRMASLIWIDNTL